MVRASLLVSVLMAAAPSCPDLYSLATHGFTAPTVDMTKATAAPDPAGLRVFVSLTAVNPNPYPISLSGVDYQVAVQGAVVLAGTEPALEVPESGGQSTVQFSGVIPTAGLAPGQTVVYTVSGAAHLDSPAGVPVDVEFSDHGTFVVPSGVP